MFWNENTYRGKHSTARIAPCNETGTLKGNKSAHLRESSDFSDSVKLGKPV